MQCGAKNQPQHVSHLQRHHRNQCIQDGALVALRKFHPYYRQYRSQQYHDKRHQTEG